MFCQYQNEKAVYKMTDSEKLDLILSRLGNLENDVSTLKNDVSGLKQDVQTLKESNLQTQITLENTVNKCIQAMGEGFKLNAERLDGFNVESIKNQSDLAVMIAKSTNEKVDRLIKQLNQPA